MGVSDKYYFAWLKEAIRPVSEQLRESLPDNPVID